MQEGKRSIASELHVVRYLSLALCAIVVTASWVRAGEERAFHLRLAATIVEPQTGDVSISWHDLLTDELERQIEPESTCVGRAHAGVTLMYAKGGDDAIMVTGEVHLFEGRGCKKRVVATQVVNTSIAKDAEVVVPVELRSARNDQLFGMLVLQNAVPSCSATHVRWRAHMHIVDHDDWSRDDTGDFDSPQVSLLLEPDEVRPIAMLRVVDGETGGGLRSDLTATADHSLNVRSMLDLAESGSLFELLEGDAIDARATDSTVLPPGTEREVRMTARDAGRVDVSMTIDNRGQPQSPWCRVPAVFAPYLLGWGPVLTLIPSGCEAMLRGCFSRADRSGWIRIDDVTCSGSGTTRRCVLRGRGTGLVCPGASWTFTDAVADADCMGARLVPSCLRNDAAVLRLTPGGATIRRASRADETALVAGGACQ